MPTDDEIHPVDLQVGRRVAERRISLGLTQTDLGKALGLSFQQVQKYERGANRISASKLWLAAAVLCVDIDYFFAGLAPSASGMSEPTGPAFDYGAAGTTQSRALSKLAPRLSIVQQKLMVTLMREMAREPVEG